MTRQHITVKVDVKAIAPKIKLASKGAQHILTQQVLKDSNLYAPQDTSNLMSSGPINSNFDDGKVIWNTPYARKLYFGLGYNFSKDRNPRAGPLWYERARAAHLTQWETIAQKAVERGL